MAIEDIETYDELDEYCKEKGYENLTDEEFVAETWCRISPYYEQYEESYVYIVIHVEE